MSRIREVKAGIGYGGGRLSASPPPPDAGARTRGKARRIVLVALMGLGLGVAGLGMVLSRRGHPEPDDRAATALMQGLAAAVLAGDDAGARAWLHPLLAAELSPTVPAAETLKAILPDPPVLSRFAHAHFSYENVRRIVSIRATGRIQADLGDGARFEAGLIMGLDNGRWKLLGLTQ